MLFLGDVHIYVNDFEAALNFWTAGLGLEIAEREQAEHSAYALLDFPDGGPSIRLFWPADGEGPSGAGDEPLRQNVMFDIATSSFDDTLVKCLDSGATQMEKIETYEGTRVVTLADPDGNMFELYEVPEEDDA
ncbi:MAG: VOC family protein [Phycisphaerae bacterium]